jgi:hypothetical protein
MLTFLHTAPSNVAVFDALLKELAPDVPVKHIVDEAILREVRDAGAVTPYVVERVDQTMSHVTTDASLVLCTCSTIGGLAEAERPNVLRVDRPMAEKAVSLGTRIGVAATLQSTLEPTKALIRDVASQAGVDVHITELFLASAWPFMERGDNEGYAREIATKLAEACAAQTFDVIVLAQASMAAAEPLCAALGLPCPMLSSPRLGVEAALARLARNHG